MPKHKQAPVIAVEPTTPTYETHTVNSHSLTTEQLELILHVAKTAKDYNSSITFNGVTAHISPGDYPITFQHRAWIKPRLDGK
jgi:hypothetical protein